MTTPTPSSVWVVCDKEGDCLFASEHKSIADNHFQHCVDEESDFRAGPYTLTEYVPKRNLAAAQERIQAAEARAEANERDAGRWIHYASSPQTALQLGTKLDPNESGIDWAKECARLADAAIAEGK